MSVGSFEVPDFLQVDFNLEAILKGAASAGSFVGSDSSSTSPSGPTQSVTDCLSRLKSPFLAENLKMDLLKQLWLKILDGNGDDLKEIVAHGTRAGSKSSS